MGVGLQSRYLEHCNAGAPCFRLSPFAWPINKRLPVVDVGAPVAKETVKQ